MEKSPRHWLEAEYLRRKQKNPAYSLRSFSRLLDLPSGRVSQLLSAKRNLTPALAKKIALRLSYDPARTSEFLAAVEGSRRKEMPPPSGTYAPLDMDQFQTIADPLHFAILSLLETKDFQGTLKEVAQRLGVSPVEARAALDRLERLGLAHTSPLIRLAKSPGLTTSHDVQSAALRLAHKKVLEETAAALEEVAVEIRDITSITMAIDPAKLPQAKQKLREFRRALSEFLETGAQTEVYRLNIQLVPVSKRKEK
jgi:uncharacterized protein (TIGR02147 family)